ncbi:MAG: HXXEE domain-containing protein [Xanthobacteraceae bacterium]
MATDQHGVLPTIAHQIAENWQRSLPVLAVVTAALWFMLFRHDPGSERAIFAALLVIYMLHQIEEHLWPGGFRQYTNAHVFKSGRDDWPVDEGGVALVNIGYVWLPVAAAALFPEALRWLGLGWIGLTLVNALTHIATSIRFRGYNPGLVTSIVLFLPFTIWALAHEVAHGALSGAAVAALLVAGVVLHVPVAALFVVPFRRRAPALV